MSKPISNAKFRKLIKAMPPEKQRESLERSLRVLPQFILEEAGRVDGHYNPKGSSFLNHV